MVTLQDPKHALPPYDAIVLVAPQQAQNKAFLDALRPLIGAINVQLMREANRRTIVGGEGASPESVARWLWEEIVRRVVSRVFRSAPGDRQRVVGASPT
jgi:osmoprotectant transport system permease protein